jgi:hypothetical protein
MSAKPEQKKETDTGARKGKGRFVKGALIAAFALATGALVVDDLSLRVENYVLREAVVELLLENDALQNNPGGDVVPMQPRNRTLEVSVPAKPAPVKAAKANSI